MVNLIHAENFLWKAQHSHNRPKNKEKKIVGVLGVSRSRAKGSGLNESLLVLSHTVAYRSFWSIFPLRREIIDAPPAHMTMSENFSDHLLVLT